MKKILFCALGLLLIQPVFYTDKEMQFEPNVSLSPHTYCNIYSIEKEPIGILILNYRSAATNYNIECGFEKDGELDMFGRFINLSLNHTDGSKHSILPNTIENLQKLQTIKFKNGQKTYLNFRVMEGIEIEDRQTVDGKVEICSTKDICEIFSIGGKITESRTFGISSLTLWRVMSV